MKVRELIVALTKVDPDAAVRIYAADEDTRCPRVVGVDPYDERAVFLVTDEVSA